VRSYRYSGMIYDNERSLGSGMGTGYDLGFANHDEITREADDGYD